MKTDTRRVRFKLIEGEEDGASMSSIIIVMQIEAGIII
jgi:hypothetical protein